MLQVTPVVEKQHSTRWVAKEQFVWLLLWVKPASPQACKATHGWTL